MAVFIDAECDGLHEDPRHHEVDVREARRADRATEHVAEQQHEHDRLHAREKHRFGDPRVGDQVALRHRQGVEHEPFEAHLTRLRRRPEAMPPEADD